MLQNRWGVSWHGSPFSIVEQQPWEANLTGAVRASMSLENGKMANGGDTASLCLFVPPKLKYSAYHAFVVKV